MSATLSSRLRHRGWLQIVLLEFLEQPGNLRLHGLRHLEFATRRVLLDQLFYLAQLVRKELLGVLSERTVLERRQPRVDAPDRRLERGLRAWLLALALALLVEGQVVAHDPLGQRLHFALAGRCG